jgi:hypothetical protein
MSRHLRALAVAFVLVVLAACGGQPVSKIAGAAIGTGLAVGAAGVNRAATGECWASCRPGMICDKASGLCVEQGSRTGAPRAAPRAPAGEQYEPGHEYVVPPAEEIRDAGADAAP